MKVYILSEEQAAQITEALDDGRPAMIGELYDKAIAALTPTEVPESARTLAIKIQETHDLTEMVLRGFAALEATK